MEYRIRKEIVNEKLFYRAEVNHRTLYGTNRWVAIEEDNTSLCGCTHLYNTVDEAEDAIKKHHEKTYANTKDDESSVLKTFNL